MIMKKAISFCIAALMIASVSILASSVSAAAATDVEVDWTNANGVSMNVSNGRSWVDFEGGGNSLTGQFRAIDYSYGRVDAPRATGLFTGGGGYELLQYNEMKNGKIGMVRAYTNGENGFISAKTDAWGAGTSLKTHSWHGIWPGTDEAVVYAEGKVSEGNGPFFLMGGYGVGISGSHWTGSIDSRYDLNVSGDGSAGIGTWTAGSNSVLKAGGKVSGDVLVKGEGNGFVSQRLQDVGSIDFRMSWD